MSDRTAGVIRDERASDLLELMLVFGVATILLIRGFLALTGYPQLGGGGLHIAHMLWGGLGMLLSISLLLNFWTRAIRQVAAAVGGIGFGFFIDELGKFITSDNDYFYQPTIALIYVIFIGLFVVTHAVQSSPVTAREHEANRRIDDALKSDADSRAQRLYMATRRQIGEFYRFIVSRRWFAPLLGVGFTVDAVVQIIALVRIATGRGGDTARNVSAIEYAAWTLSALFIAAGVVRLLTRSRLPAYRWFQRATLVNICVTQVFVFYYSELAALGGLAIHLAIYAALRFLIAAEDM